MEITCPVCGNTVEQFVPLNESFSLDTIGSLKFCTTVAGLYIHGRNVAKNEDTFDSFSTVKENISE